MGQHFMPVPGKARLRLLTFCWNTGQMQTSRVSSHYCCETLGRFDIHLGLVDQGGWTPLHHASLRGHVGVVKCLLEFKINPNMKGRSAGLFMFMFSHMHTVENDGWTPLHLACANSHFGVADYLLDHNADPNIRSGSFFFVPWQPLM